MTLVAGVDSSTQSTKVEVRDAASGALVASGRAPHPPVGSPRSEQDPNAWWDAFEIAWADAGAPSIDAISVSAQQHAMVTLDRSRAVIRPAKLWNDTESAADAARLTDRLDGGASAWVDACGSVLRAAFTITKLAWLQRTEPDAWARLASVCLPHDWLTMRLSGELVTDRGDASGTGYWSPKEGRYRTDLLDLVDGDRDWPTMLPPVLGPTDVAGRWSGALVAPGTGDNMAAALGLGLLPGDVAISIGTSGTVFTVSEQPSTDPTGAVAGFADATGRFLPLVCTLNATKVTDAVARLLGVDASGLDSLALSAPTGAGGLTLLPYLDGERTPDRPDASGLLAGLRSDITREQVARAAFEGVVCGLLDGLDALTATAPTAGRLLVVGGGARSTAYRQILADLSGREVYTVDLDEAVATGACVQAAAVAGSTTPDAVRRAWSAVRSTCTEPTDDSVTAPGRATPGGATRGEVRAAYAAVCELADQ